MLNKIKIKILVFALAVLTAISGGAHIVLADDVWVLNGSDSFTGTVSVAMPVNDLQISGSTGGTIPVKLRVTNGTLAMSTTTGLTFTGGTSGSTLQFSGAQADLNAALATLTYTRGSTGSDTLEVSLVNPGEVFFTDNGHLYKYISGTITWNAAQSAATALTAYNSSGYLATITSAAENNFVAARITGDGWFGASDSVSEGVWRWVTGPEANTQFWSGNGSGSTVGGNYARWASGEPNNSGSNEHCAQFYVSNNFWNDLPCNNTLGGYIVEFGASGDLPEVTAKNISITTQSTPAVSVLSPADNATAVNPAADLVMTFSQVVTKDTGDITIKKTSDNTTVETIPVSGELVTGSGTSTITINPVADLAESTGYYINIPNTAFKNNSNAYYTGISNATSWNFTTGDLTEPVISGLNVAPSDTSAVITWTTNESASTLVAYGFTSGLGSFTSETDTSPRILSHSKSLTDLFPCTTYYYVATSKDAANNTVSSDINHFTTTGCEDGATPEATQSKFVNISTGGESALTSNDNTLLVTFPENVTTPGVSGSLLIQIHALINTDILANLGKPSSVLNEVGPVIFDVKAIIDGDTILDSFDAPVTIEYEYTDEDVTGLDESSLWLYHYHDNEWQRLESCNIDTGANAISCTTDSFSLFALFGSAQSNVTSGSRVIKKVCKDTAALNYQPEGRHVAGLCIYSPTPVSVPQAAPVQKFARDLQLGMTGEDVREIQKFLNQHGFLLAGSGAGSLGNETTLFGQLTRNALLKYQNANGIFADGIFSSKTREYINAGISSKIPLQSQTASDASVIQKVRDLTIGMSGDDVKGLQEILIGQGYAIAAGPTGFFASQTKAALSYFQKDKNVTPAVGYFGPATRAVMKSIGVQGIWW